MAHAVQMSLRFRQNGGWRRGAGRPKGSRVSHLRRPEHSKHHPLHITLRCVPDAPNLRSFAAAAVLGAAFKRMAADPKWARVIEFSLQSNHIHLIVEADSREELTRGMRRITIRLALALNKHLGRHGS